MKPGPYVVRALMAAGKLDLSQLERQELAEYLTGHEGSWSRMSEEDGKRVGDALQSFHAVQWLIATRDRQPAPRPALRHTA